MGVVLHGMTHQAVADHFNVSRITISGLMIRLRQTGRTNDRHRSGSAHVTSQRQDRHLRLIHLRNRMITDEDTARRKPGLEFQVRLIAEDYLNLDSVLGVRW